MLGPCPSMSKAEPVLQIRGFPAASGLRHQMVGTVWLIGSSVFVN